MNFKENEKNVRIPLIHACLILVLISLFNEVTITGTLLLCSLILLEYLFAGDFLKKMKNPWNVSNQLNFLHVSSNSSINETYIRVNKTNFSQTTFNGFNECEKSSKENDESFDGLSETGKRRTRKEGNLKDDLERMMTPENAKVTYQILRDIHKEVDRKDYTRNVFYYCKALEEKYNEQFEGIKNKEQFPRNYSALGRAAAINGYDWRTIKREVSSFYSDNHLSDEVQDCIRKYKARIPEFKCPYSKSKL